MRLLIGFVLTVSVGALVGAQEQPALPEPYQAFLQATQAEMVSKPVTEWLTERQKTQTSVRERLPGINRLGGKEISFESLFKRYGAKGYEYHQGFLRAQPAEFAAVLLSTDRERGGRRDFVEGMLLIEKQDERIRKALKEDGREGVTAVQYWADYQVKFATDYAAKLVRAQANAPLPEVTVRTVDPYTGKEEQHYEVAFVPALWRGNQAKERRFPRLSSPSKHELEAGDYYVWSRRLTRNGYVSGTELRLLITKNVSADVYIPLPP